MCAVRGKVYIGTYAARAYTHTHTHIRLAGRIIREARKGAETNVAILSIGTRLAQALEVVQLDNPCHENTVGGYKPADR